MNSEDLSVLNFSGWAKFNRAHERLVLENLPSLKGIYAVRGKRTEALLRGASDIVYLGCAANKDGLRKRVQEYFHPGVSQSTCKRINELVMSCDDYDLSYATALDTDCAKQWECAILHAFLLDHDQLPPQNRRSPTAMTGDAVEAVLRQWAIYPQPDWSTRDMASKCSVCGAKGRFVQASSNDPFYTGPCLSECNCGASVCGDTACQAHHVSC